MLVQDSHNLNQLSVEETKTQLQKPTVWKKIGTSFQKAWISVADFFAPINPVSQTRRFRAIPLDLEMFLGEVTYGQLYPKENCLDASVDDQRKKMYVTTVNRIFTKLVEQSERKGEFKYEVKVVESKEVNAACLPGGKMMITTAILDKAYRITNGDSTRFENAVAFIMGHELTHANASHGIGKLTLSMTASIVGYIAGTILGFVVADALADANKKNIDASPNLTEQQKRDRKRQTEETAFTIALYSSKFFRFIADCLVHLLVVYNSRQNEYEADRHSLVYLKKAGYNFREGALDTMKVLKDDEEHSKAALFFLRLLSTHPVHEDRLAAINEEIVKLEASAA